jgi:hypothetical protein
MDAYQAALNRMAQMTQGGPAVSAYEAALGRMGNTIPQAVPQAVENFVTNPAMSPVEDMARMILNLKTPPGAVSSAAETAAPTENIVGQLLSRGAKAVAPETEIIAGTNINKLVNTLRNLKLSYGGLGNLSGNRGLALTGLMPSLESQAMKGFGVDTGVGPFGLDTGLIGAIGGSLIGGFPGLFAGVASPLVGAAATALGEASVNDYSENWNQLANQQGESGTTLRTHRHVLEGNAPPESSNIPASAYINETLPQYKNPEATSNTASQTAGEAGLSQQIENQAEQNKPWKFNDFLAAFARADAHIKGGGYTPYQERALRAEVADEAMKKMTPDNSDPMLVGAWNVGGMDAINNMLQQRQGLQFKLATTPTVGSKIFSELTKQATIENEAQDKMIQDEITSFQKASTNPGTSAQWYRSRGVDFDGTQVSGLSSINPPHPRPVNVPIIDPKTRQPVIDPATGQPKTMRSDSLTEYFKHLKSHRVTEIDLLNRMLNLKTLGKGLVNLSAPAYGGTSATVSTGE